MHLLDSVGRPQSTARGAGERTDVHGQRFALGGVVFELLASDPSRRAGFPLEPDAARYCVPVDRYPVVADVLCSVEVDDVAFEGASHFGGLELRKGAIADLAHGALELHAPRVKAVLCRIGSNRYACSARIASDPRALTALLRSIAAIAVHEAGGLMMHAAAIVLRRSAILFVGPSGAGKSTAAALTTGARLFASDHVAVIPHEGGALAYGMPGGTAAAMSFTDEVVWPLKLVLRVLRDGANVAAPHVPRARVASGAEALFLVREAIESADLSKAAEDARLAAAEAIARSATVGTVHTVLGTPIGELLRGLISEEAQS